MDETNYDESVDFLMNLYRDFHERYLDPSAGPILELGVGSGLSALPLVAKGYTVIGIDNDAEALEMCRMNSRHSSNPEKLVLVKADLYDPDWWKQFVGKNIQGVVSYGVLEHFTEDDLMRLIPRQFDIAPRAIAMMPVNTPRTLALYGATGKEEGDVDINGIFRIWRTGEYWQKDILEADGCRVIEAMHFPYLNPPGPRDAFIFVLEKAK